MLEDQFKPIDWQQIDPYLIQRPEPEPEPIKRRYKANRKKRAVKSKKQYISDATKIQIYWMHWYSNYNLPHYILAQLFKCSVSVVSRITNDHETYKPIIKRDY